MKKLLSLMLFAFPVMSWGQSSASPVYNGTMGKNLSIPVNPEGINGCITGDQIPDKKNPTFRGTLAEARTGADGFNKAVISDYGGGTFYCDAADNTSADNTGTIFVTTKGARFKRIVTNFIQPEWFGVYGDSLDHVPAFQRLVNSDINDKTIRFGSGVYIVANDVQRVIIEKKKNFKLQGNGGTTFANWAGNGGTGGENFWIDTCENVEISGIRMLDLVLTRASTYNNLLVIVESKNVKVHDCYFGFSSNKHIHVGGSTQNLEINNCVFENGHYNTNPSTNSAFGSIFMYVEGPTQRLGGISIHNNKFKNNMLFCVSVNNFNIASNSRYENIFSNITVKDNTIDSCAAAFIIRANGFIVDGNTITNTGAVMYDKYYVYLKSLQRYFSKSRQNAGFTPTIANTMVPLHTGGIFTFAGSRNFSITNNTFAGGLLMQDVNVAGVAQETVYMNASTAQRGYIHNNNFIDSVNATVYKPLITVFTSPAGLNFDGNNFLLPKTCNAANVVRINNGSANRAFLNRFRLKGTTAATDHTSNTFQYYTCSGKCR